MAGINEIIDKCYAIKFDKDVIADVYDFQKFVELNERHDNIKNQSNEKINKVIESYNIFKTMYKKYQYNTIRIEDLDFKVKTFDIKIIYNYQEYFDESVKFILFRILIGNFVIMTFFIAMRQMFYYVILGKLNPEK